MPATHRRGHGSLLWVLLASAWSAGAQELPARIMPAPAAVELDHAFTDIRGVFELSDGRILVLDRGDASLWIADSRTQRVQPLGRTGAGPGEYRAPYRLYPLGGDSVGVLDEASSRLLVVHGDGSLGGFVSPLLTTTSGLFVTAALSDVRGYFYGEAIRGLPDGSAPRDSVAVVRWLPNTGTYEVAGRVERKSSAAPGSITMPGSALALEARDGWAVGRDGRLAVVSSDPYAVTLVQPNGTVLRGPPIAHRRQPVTDSVRRAYLAELDNTSVAIVANATGATAARRGAPPPRVIRNWAADVPAFRPNALLAFDGDVLWVQRTSFGHEPTRYDLFNSQGAVLDRIQFPAGVRVVGFGRVVTYTVRTDDDDNERLQVRPQVAPSR